MRLLRLKIKNIASLKGEHLVDFEEITRQSPLFAITGETGAGKSSVLNSIGLALYGQIFKKNVVQNDVVTLGEKEGQIELIFEVKGKTYLAFWRAKVRKQSGELYSTPQSPTRELYTLDGHDFNSPKTILLKKVDDILNLDFDQFTKCVILNQGEFAKFLSSTFTERKDILEKLYPGEMLESMGRELNTEVKLVEKEKNDLDIELKTLAGDGDIFTDLKALEENISLKFSLRNSWLETIQKLDFHFISLHSYHSKFLENKNKIQLIKNEISEETTKFNLLLKDSEKSSSDLKLAQSEADQKLPHLHELLKSEEALSGAKKKKEENTLELKKLEKEFELLKVTLESTLKRQENCLYQKKALEILITSPLESLKLYKDILPPFFDLLNDRELISQDLASREERLNQLELSGKETSTLLSEVTLTLGLIPETVVKDLEATKLKKTEAQEQLIKSQRLEARLFELQAQLIKLESDLTSYSEKIESLRTKLKTLEADKKPLETIVQLKDLISAVLVCRTHPEAHQDGNCPVCEQPVDQTHWDKLTKLIDQNDMKSQEIKLKDLSRLEIQSQEELKLLLDAKEKVASSQAKSREEIKDAESTLKASRPDISSLEEEIEKLKKLIWEQDALNKRKLSLEEELKKSREEYKSQKIEITKKKDLLGLKVNAIQASLKELNGFVTDSISKEEILKLKAELKTFSDYQKCDSEVKQIHTELHYLDTKKRDLDGQHQLVKERISESEKIETELTLKLAKELSGVTAKDAISQITTRLKFLTEENAKREENLKKQELKVKEFQSRLYTYNEQTLDLEFHFTKELHEVKRLAGESLKPLSQELTETLNLLKDFALTLQSPSDLFIPLKERLTSLRESLTKSTNEAREELASTRARLQDWEKKQDRIKLIELKRKDLIDKLSRLNRLFDVLGKDELRTFVLSMVEENLIAQTNEELQRLCQGRYEIVHQTKAMKMSPEFYVLDKFREGGRRKVSTLSGGETFMVSLAMALGLAEMTRGQAEIDSLFIDEGFGTLDQESLEDVLEMLGQIQTRGLMVGIISHIKQLTDSLPVNLVLRKKNDGTSSVTIRSN